MKAVLTIPTKYSHYFRGWVTTLFPMHANTMAYKYLRHTIYILGVVCLVFIGFSGYSNNTSFATETEVSFTQDNTGFDQQVLVESTAKGNFKNHNSSIHRRHNTSRRFLEKPTGKEIFSSFAGATPGGSFTLFANQQFGPSSYTVRLRYYVLLFLYALF